MYKPVSSVCITNTLALVPALLVLGLSVQPGFARPEYFARYRAFPFARPELKTCGVCHENPKGGGPRNEFGQAFSQAGRQFTPELRTQFPDRFLQDRARLGDDVEIVFESTETGAILVKRGKTSYRVIPATKTVEKIAEAGPETRGAASLPSPDGGGGSPVFDYQLVNVRSGKVMDKGEFHFRFSHRFTTPVFNQSGRQFDLFGLDSFALPGIGVGFGLTNRLGLNVYRQTYERKLEFSGDFSLVEQEESSSPISVMARAGIEGRNDFAGQGHKGHYIPSIQFVLSRNFLNRLALNVNPTFAFNLRRPGVPAIDKRLVAIGLGGSIKIRDNMALVGEFIPRVSGRPFRKDFVHDEPTASFGFQFRTSRHVFEFLISNSYETTIAGSALGGPDEKHIGFNIYRRIK